MMIKVLKYLFFVCTLSLADMSFAKLWISENQWSAKWESEYSSWIANGVDKNFFVKANLETDCADAVIALRIIFAKQNKLPFQFTTNSGESLSNLSTRFNLSDNNKNWFEDNNFVSALKFILNNTSSKTLIKDSVAIGLSAGEIKSGSFFIHDFNNSGHVDLVHKVILNGQIYPIRMLSSTVPKKTRELIEYPFYFTSKPIHNKTGFFRFKTVLEKNDETLTLANNNKDNLEQYSTINLDVVFSDYVSLKLLKTHLIGYSKAYDLINLLAKKINERVNIVRDGFNYCVQHDCSDQSTGFYNYSTPSRDSNIFYIVIQLQAALAQSQNQQDEFQQTSELVSEFYNLTFLIENDLKLTGKQVMNTWLLGKYSSNPQDSIAARWGLGR